MSGGAQQDVMSIASDEAVMAAVCARDDDRAFAELVTRWRTRLQQTCYRLTGNHADAEDAVQEAFTRAFMSRDQFRGQASFATWFWRIAVNVAHDVRRRSVRQKELSGTAGHSVSQPDNAQERAVSAERRGQVLEALEQLTETQRTVVVLRHYEQLKFREISEVLGVPEGTVASRMADALNRLSQLLKPE